MASTNKNVDGVIIPMTQAEIDERDARVITHRNFRNAKSVEEFREHRNELLAKTDYYGLPDQTMTPEMTTYRQALRDAPEGIETFEQAKAFVWAVNPEE